MPLYFASLRRTFDEDIIMADRSENIVLDAESEDSVGQEMPLAVFDLSLDASSDITGMTMAVQSLSAAVKEIRVDIYNSFTTRWEEEAVPNLFSALGRVPKLLKIEFYGLRIFPYKMPIAMAERALSNAIHLEEFCLVGLNLSSAQPTNFSIFSETLRRHPSLKTFVLDNCSLDDEVNGPALDEAIVRILVQIPTLEKVVLRATEGRMWARLSIASIGLLCSSAALISLELTVFCDEDEAVMTEMAKSLTAAKNYSKLTELSISGCLGGLVGAKALSNMLSLNTRLKSLEVHLRSQSEDDEAGIIEISRALVRSKTLTKFELHGSTNDSGSRDVRKAYLQMLQRNYSLTASTLLFHRTFLLPDSQYYAKINSVGRGRLLGNINASRDEWVNILVDVKNDLDGLYYFLRAQPSLCSSSVSVIAKKKRKMIYDTRAAGAHALARDDTAGTIPNQKRLKSK